MKKIICTLISFAILILSISISFPVFAQEIEMKQIENFSENCVDLVHEYDEGKEFEAVTEETDELDDLQFQTARLFVKCSSLFNKMGAEKKVSGFENWHILHFTSPAEAKKAYLYYKEQKKIEAVEPDVAFNVDLDEAGMFSEYDENSDSDVKPTATNEPTYITREEFDNDYSKRILGTNEVLAYIKEHNIKTSEIKVGIIDSGIDYNHELFNEDRVFRTKFNATNAGEKDDEMDLNSYSNYHGTAVASCIVSTTPDSVKVAAYRSTEYVGREFHTEISWIVCALMRAYTNGCSVVNISLSIPFSTEILEDTLRELKDAGIQIFVAAGNGNAIVVYNKKTGSLFGNENVLSVGASDNCNRRAGFSNMAYFLAFLAPGKDVAVAVGGNKYMLTSGTSFSSPYAAGVFATLKSLNSDFSDEKIIDLMKYTCTDVFFPFNNDKAWFGNINFGSGILDAYRALCEMQGLPLVPDVEFSLPTGECSVGYNLELTCEGDYEIYYTTDLTVADKKHGIKYTDPITITEDTVINAIAYDKNGNRGQNKVQYYITFEKADESDFIIDDSGTIIGYNGTIRKLEIPEKINGITVTGIHYDLFNGECECEGIVQPKVILTALKLPETVEYLEEDLFYDTDLEYFSAPNLKELPACCFGECKNLIYVNLPKVEKVGSGAFQGCISLRVISLPNCTEVHDAAFETTSPDHVYLPKLKYYYGWFLSQTNILDLYCPELTEGFKEFGSTLFARNLYFLGYLSLPKLKAITRNMGFEANSLSMAEFSEIETLKNFPANSCILVLPLTLKQIDMGYQNPGSNNTFTIYGTKDSYAEQWANENSIEFIELNQETAVYTDVRETCNEYTETLFFDSLGFHKSYQWYGTFDDSTENGIAIEGADKELIHLKDYREYPYYYCVCTSTDIGDGREHVEKIYSKVCQNTDYQSADYTKYNEAVKYANSLDKSLYKDLSKVDEALNIDVANLPYSMQNHVDEATKAILDAINSLEFTETSTESSTETSTESSTESTTESTTETVTEDTTAEKSTEKPTDTDRPDNPKTGGNNSIRLCASFVMLSFAVAVFVMGNKKKKE